MSHYKVGYEWRIYELIEGYSDVLDIGFGYGLWGYELKVRRIIKNITGIEPFKPYCDIVGSFNVYDRIINKNVYDIPNNSIKKPVVLCCDVIEHNNKELADTFIDKLESWSTQLTIIATPNGNMINESETDENILNKHKSFYNKEFFENRGYKVEIVRYYPDAPKIFRPLIKIYNYIRGNKGITSAIIAVKHHNKEKVVR